MLSSASIAVKMWFQERGNDDCQGGAEDSRCIPLARTAQSGGEQLSHWRVLALFLGKLVNPSFSKLRLVEKSERVSTSPGNPRVYGYIPALP